jgi:hypothetical protein
MVDVGACTPAFAVSKKPQTRVNDEGKFDNQTSPWRSPHGPKLGAFTVTKGT